MTCVSDHSPAPAEKNVAADAASPHTHPHVADDTPVTLAVNAQGSVIAASPSSVCLLGYAPDALLGKQIESFVHPDDHAAVRAVLGVSNQGASVSHENLLSSSQNRVRGRVRAQDGTWHEFAISALPLMDGSAQPPTLITLQTFSPPLPPAAPRAVAEEVPAGTHAVQFYESDEFLVDLLARFVQAGLAAGEACVVIATQAHRARLETRLGVKGLDLAAIRRDGWYVTRDADQLLRTFMEAGAPDPDRFAHAVGRLINRATHGQRKVRLFGEMVAQLWQGGNPSAALRLEALWNELQQRTSPAFTLLCAYPAGVFAGHEHQSAFAAVGHQHAQVLPAETYSALEGTDERLRAVARLQQQAHSLRVEIAQRQLTEERLRRSERHYRNLFEGSVDGLLMIEPDTGRINDANRAALALLGATYDDVVGQDLWQIGLFPDQEATRQVLRAVNERSVIRLEALTLRTTDIRREVEFVAHLVRVDGADERAFIQCTLRDVTERKHLEREVAQRTSELEAIQTVTDATLAHASLEALLPELLERVRTALAVDNVAILLPDGTGRDLRIYLARGPEEEVAGQVRVPIGQGVAGTIASTRQPLIIDDLRLSKAVNPFLRERLRSLMGVPLLVEDRLVGVIHVDTIEPHQFTQPELRLLQLVADRIALAIERAQLHQAAQQARREAMERANQLFATIESISDGVVVFDPDMQLIQMNRTAQRLLGYTAPPHGATALREFSQLLARDRYGQLVSLEDRPVSRVLRGEVITGAQAVDLTIPTAQGRDLQVSVAGAPVRNEAGTVLGAVCVFRDVTEQRRLEQRTHEALTALLAMAGFLVDLPADADPFESNPRSPVPVETSAHATPSHLASPVAQRLAHLAREVLGCQRVSMTAIEPATQLQIPIAVVGLAPELEHQWWERHHTHPSRYGEGMDRKLRARFEAGEALALDMTKPPHNALPNPYGVSTVLVAPLRAGSQLVGILALDYDGAPHRFTEDEQALARAVGQLVALIIERDRLLREREEARATALAAQETTTRMHTFLGIAGHELRTPVTSIKASVQLSERALHTLLEMSLPAETTRPLQRAQTLLARADQQANRLNRLIEDMLDVTRMQEGKLSLHSELSDLGGVVRQAVEAQHSSWPSREMTLDLPAVPVRLMLDADRIEQVVANFLTNALKYSADDQPVAVQVILTPQAARVAVRDRGPGLSRAMQQQIWEPFQQVEGIRQQSGSGVGLGLGLHICRTIVEGHGGRVGVESVVGAGSTFWFELPLTPSPSDMPGTGAKT